MISHFLIQNNYSRKTKGFFSLYFRSQIQFWFLIKHLDFLRQKLYLYILTPEDQFGLSNMILFYFSQFYCLKYCWILFFNSCDRRCFDILICLHLDIENCFGGRFEWARKRALAGAASIPGNWEISLLRHVKICVKGKNPW